MQAVIRPAFPPQWQPLVERAATALRALALDEVLKQRFCDDPLLRPLMHKVSRRYVAGHGVADAVARVAAIGGLGHAASAEYMGESCHQEEKAVAETAVFLDLIAALDAAGLPCMISFDLSHLGALIDPEFGYRQARQVVQAAAASGREVMISMEGAERADLIYGIYGRLHDEAGLANVGITLPAKLHRSAADLPRLMAYPGRIRLVKGAFLETESIAYGRDSVELAGRYREFGQRLLASGHACSIATHDAGIQQDLCRYIADQHIEPGAWEFESLSGLGTEQLAALHAAGHATREYLVFGEEHFLYVLNRLSEEPVRVYQALVDLLEADSASGPC